MKLDEFPLLLGQTFKPWAAADALKWPRVTVKTEDYKACCSAAIAAGKEVAQARAIDNIGTKAVEMFLGQKMPGLVVRGTTAADSVIEWKAEDRSKRYICGVVVEVDKLAKNAEVAISGWMHNGELLCFSDGQTCRGPFRPAETLIALI